MHREQRGHDAGHAQQRSHSRRRRPAGAAGAAGAHAGDEHEQPERAEEAAGDRERRGEPAPVEGGAADRRPGDGAERARRRHPRENVAEQPVGHRAHRERGGGGLGEAAREALQQPHRQARGGERHRRRHAVDEAEGGGEQRLRERCKPQRAEGAESLERVGRREERADAHAERLHREDRSDDRLRHAARKSRVREERRYHAEREVGERRRRAGVHDAAPLGLF